MIGIIRALIVMLIVYILAFTACTAHAGQITTGFISHHGAAHCWRGDVAVKCNEANHGIGYRTDSGWLAVAYRNSIGRNSIAVAREFEAPIVVAGVVRFRAGVGAVTGYNKPVLPLAYPSVSIGSHRAELVIGYLPPVKRINPAVVFAQARFGF